ncbi:MAG TPA: hypothetical protein PLU64_12165, partial [Saprospiraceae bacterium]|nr:hypothetical protein [Saprospiraceae bacterium]
KEAARQTSGAVAQLLIQEARFGLQNIKTYDGFQQRADKIKNDFLGFLVDQKQNGKLVAAYGAAAKGNTLLNYAGVKPDLLPFVCDAALSKQGKYMPGSHIPIIPPADLKRYCPDFVLILPWNIAAEVKGQHADLEQSGTRFVTVVPKLEIA